MRHGIEYNRKDCVKMNKNFCCDGGLAYGQQMNLLAVSLANAIAEGRTSDELEYLSAILQLAGEALSVIAAVQAKCENGQNGGYSV